MPHAALHVELDSAREARGTLRVTRYEGRSACVRSSLRPEHRSRRRSGCAWARKPYDRIRRSGSHAQVVHVPLTAARPGRERDF